MTSLLLEAPSERCRQGLSSRTRCSPSDPPASIGLIACINPSSWSPQLDTTLPFDVNPLLDFVLLQLRHYEDVALHLGLLAIQVMWSMQVVRLS
jgi:hypothetical protein